MNVDVIWSNILKKIKEELSTLSYDTWFSETELYKLKDGKAYIIVPMPVHKKHLMDNYRDIIIEKMHDVIGENYDIHLLLKEEIEEEEENSNLKDKKNIINEKEIDVNNINSNLNPNYTFNNFVVGNSNKFAHAGALSVAENPGTMYNPLFLYGNSGLGKTHLMHAIGNYIVANTNKKVLYVTSEQFKSEFVKANKKDENGENFNYVDFFKNKYRNIDVLLIDDI